jgi:hypothetical protein
MADPTSNLEEIQNIARDIERSLLRNIADLSEYVAKVSDLSKEYVIFKNNIKEVREISTDIKHINDSILTVTKRLGIEKVREKDLQQVMNRITQARVALEKQEEIAERKKETNLTRAHALEAQHNIAKHAAAEALRRGLAEEIRIQTDKVKAIQEERQLLSDSLTEHDSLINAINEERWMLNEQEISLRKIKENLANSNNEAEITQRKFSLLEKTMRSFSKIPLIGPLLDLRSLSEEYDKGVKQGNAELKNQMSNMFKSPIALGAMAIGVWSKLFGLIKNIAKAVLAFDESLTKVANNLGMSVDATRALVSGFFDSGDAANKLKGVLDSSFLSMTNAIKAIGSLQEGFKTSAMFSNEVLQSQILLTEQMGLEAEEAIGIQKYTYLSGVSAKSLLDTVTKQVGMQQKQNGVFLSYRKVLSDVAKVSSEISTSYKNNPKYLIDAVIQAQKLGMTLEDTRKISDSLLNFESSIESELKAELLIGKSLNYEKARSLALDGKSAEAAAEIIKQMGGLNGLTNLNVIQRKAIADSAGLTTEELTKAAQQEKLIAEIGKGSAAALQEQYDTLVAKGDVEKANALLLEIQRHENGEILAQDIAKASLSKRLEQSITKIKEIFVDVAQGPLISILESFANMLKHTTAVKVILGSLIVLATTLAGVLTTAAIAATIASGGSNLALAAGAGVGALLGGATLIGTSYAMSAGSSSTKADQNAIPTLNSGNVTNVNDAAISPRGNIMISTPEGQMIKVGRRDYVYTTPVPPSEMLAQGDTSSSTTRGDITSNSSSEVATLLKELITITKAGGDVYLDGRKVGEVMGLSFNSFG